MSADNPVYRGVMFCSPWDALAAESGAPAIYLRDRNGAFRLEPMWTRDAWSRLDGTWPALRWTWFALRDRGTGYVVLVLATSPDLLRTHPRMDIREVSSMDAGIALLERLGPVAVAPEAW